jgi:hypothetical protein
MTREDRLQNVVWRGWSAITKNWFLDETGRAQAIPKEWVLVPREPTREMWAASGDAQMKGYGGFNIHHDVVSECVWSAMIASAPAHEKL